MNGVILLREGLSIITTMSVNFSGFGIRITEEKQQTNSTATPLSSACQVSDGHLLAGEGERCIVVYDETFWLPC